MRCIILLFLFAFFSCSRNTKDSVNPEAKKLLDSAVVQVTHFQDFKRAVSLLDQAIKIDSNYFAAYNTKFAFLGSMKPNDINEMLPTLLKMIKLRPEIPIYYFYAGMIYVKKGDSLTANKYLANADVHFDKFLDTMHQTNSAYELLLSDKAFSLILQGQDQKGRDLLKQVYQLETDSSNRINIATLLAKTRQEILDSILFEK